MAAFLSNKFLFSKVGGISSPTMSKATEIVDAAHKAGHRIRFVWGMGSSAEHRTGRALDIMVYDHAAGEFVRNYVWTHRERLRLTHVIWAQTITSTVNQPGKRRQMADRGSVTENHFDHNHIWFLDDKAYVPPNNAPAPRPVSAKKSNTQIAGEVWAGKWGNGEERVNKLKAAGYNPKTIQELVSRGVGKHAEVKPKPPTNKTVPQLAREVIQGKWGNGEERVRRLSKAGYNAKLVQNEVNRRL